jgi:hypothetical protein
MNKTARLIVALSFISLLVVPNSEGRGFGGRGFGGGGFSRGSFGGGGFDRGGFSRGGFGGDGGFNRGGMNRAMTPEGFARYGGGARNMSEMGAGAFPRSAYGGGGFSSIAGAKAGSVNSLGLAGQTRFSQFSGHNPSQLASDGSLGSVAGRENQFSNRNFQNVDANRVNAERGNTFNTNINRGNISTGYHPNYGAYGRYGGYGYHPYGAYGYHRYGAYGGIYGYPGGWYNPGFMEASMWTCMGVSTLSSFLGIAALSNSKKSSPASNVTYEGDNVYINGQPAQQYYQQGQQLAASANAAANQQYPNTTTTPLNQQLAYNPEGAGQFPGTGAATGAPVEKWEPLGVYGLTEPGQSQATMLFQLAINKDGIIRGNYLNQITNERAQIHGALDKSSQQISWSVGSNADTVFDTSLSELMKENGQVVVQFGPNNTQTMSLVRQKPPVQDNSSGNPTGTTG